MISYIDSSFVLLRRIIDNGDATSVRLLQHFDAVFPSQLLGIQSRAIYRVKAQFRSCGQKGSRLRKQLVVVAFQLDGLDEHWISRVLVLA